MVQSDQSAGILWDYLVRRWDFFDGRTQKGQPHYEGQLCILQFIPFDISRHHISIYFVAPFSRGSGLLTDDERSTQGSDTTECS